MEVYMKRPLPAHRGHQLQHMDLTGRRSPYHGRPGFYAAAGVVGRSVREPQPHRVGSEALVHHNITAGGGCPDAGLMVPRQQAKKTWLCKWYQHEGGWATKNLSSVTAK